MRWRALITVLLAMSLATVALPVRATLHYAMAVEVWTDRGEDFFYLPGDPLRVYFRTPEDCYVVLYQIDTQGNVYLLFPWPYSRAFFARAGKVYCLNDFFPGHELAVYGASGVAYIGVLAGPVPFYVPRWLKPHPVFRATRVVYVDACYPAVAVEPCLSISDLNARIVGGWGVGLRLGFGYCWFYVDDCYVPVFPIWHPRYWEVRIVTRPVYERVWWHHDRFYGLQPGQMRRGDPPELGREPIARRGFERLRTFRVSPHPQPPSWVNALREERTRHDTPEEVMPERRDRTRIGRSVPDASWGREERAPQGDFSDRTSGTEQRGDAVRQPSKRPAREGSQTGEAGNSWRQSGFSQRISRPQRQTGCFEQADARRKTSAAEPRVFHRSSVPGWENYGYKHNQEARETSGSANLLRRERLGGHSQRDEKPRSRIAHR